MSLNPPPGSARSRISRISPDDNCTDVLREVLENGEEPSTADIKKPRNNNSVHRHSSKGSRKANRLSTIHVEQRAQLKRSEQKRSIYTRPTGPEIVRPHIPSCSSLPANWTSIHDRFIAYLATHAPLTAKGNMPAKEHLRERWSLEEMTRLVGERFPKLDERIKPGIIEHRLLLLDHQGDNDYFDMEYEAYKHEEWGRGI